jgi:hypothetical protein
VRPQPLRLAHFDYGNDRAILRENGEGLDRFERLDDEKILSVPYSIIIPAGTKPTYHATSITA